MLCPTQLTMGLLSKFGQPFYVQIFFSQLDDQKYLLLFNQESVQLAHSLFHILVPKYQIKVKLISNIYVWNTQITNKFRRCRCFYVFYRTMFQLDDINILTCSVMPSDSAMSLVNNRGVLMLYQTFFDGVLCDVCMFLCRVKLSVFIELNFYDVLWWCAGKNVHVFMFCQTQWNLDVFEYCVKLD